MLILTHALVSVSTLVHGVSCISWLGQSVTHGSPLYFTADQTGRGAEMRASDHAAAVARQHEYVHSPLPGNRYFPSHVHAATAAARVSRTVGLQLSEKKTEFPRSL